MSLFQSNLRKQIRNFPKILNFVKVIHYYSKLFTGVLTPASSAPRAARTLELVGLCALKSTVAVAEKVGEKKTPAEKAAAERAAGIAKINLG